MKIYCAYCVANRNAAIPIRVAPKDQSIIGTRVDLGFGFTIDPWPSGGFDVAPGEDWHIRLYEHFGQDAFYTVAGVPIAMEAITTVNGTAICHGHLVYPPRAVQL